MTKEHFLYARNPSPLSDMARKTVLMCMDDYAAHQNKVYIDALREIVSMKRQDNETTDTYAFNRCWHIATAALASSADLPSKFEQAIASVADAAPQEVIEDEDDSGRYPGDGENESEAEFIERQLTKIKTLQKEVEELRQWKKEVRAVYDPIHEYARHHPDIKLGASMVSFVVDRAKLYDKMQGQVTGKSAGKQELTDLRNSFYDSMPSSGEIKVWDMIEWAQAMFQEFDVFIDALDESGEAGKQPEQQPVDPWTPASNPPKEGGRYWCLVEEINDLGISRFQWNCYYDLQKNEWRDNLKTVKVTHYTNLLPFPRFIQTEVPGEQKAE